ncbi:hypothetical protein BDV98DRAFT_606559 [Pterulicium gracile]|uniref:ICE2-domain-containing protein n=1 Tax=Pterulicium gracile TaxID=1884261 RepID=A0A5C3Q9M4_9AGAR|nr:hypothetical protein BDV98DRAFT_606559 [Pterula gracilis]
MSWLLWTFLSNASKLSSAFQILLVLPLTLATLTTPAFLLLSLLLSLQSIIHGTLFLVFNTPRARALLPILQLPVPFFLILVTFNTFSSNLTTIDSTPLWALNTTAHYWGKLLTFSGPAFITLEGICSLLVVQQVGKEAKKAVSGWGADPEGRGEVWQFGLLIATAVTYVGSAYWIVVSYPSAASSPLSSTLLGVAITALVFLTFIGFVLRRTNIVEASGMAMVLAYNLWLCGGVTKGVNSGPASQSYVPLSLLGNIVPHLQTLLNFVTRTLPKPVLIALSYRLAVLHLASRILPKLGAGAWEDEEGVDEGWDVRPTSTMTRIILTYRQFIFVAVYSHLLLLDTSSSIWWRWFNIFFTLLIWALELLVSPDEDEYVDIDGVEGRGWKVE